jgi:type I restriction enzyme S subunit
MEVREARVAYYSLPVAEVDAAQAGYRQTEAGVVPKEWEVCALNTVVRSHNSGVYKSQALYGSGCNIAGVSDIYRVDKIDGQRFSLVPLSAQEQAKYMLRHNDLLYGESSLVREGIARTVYVSEQGEGTAFAWHTRRYSIDQKVLLSPYLYYFLQSRAARAHMISNSIQTAITGINTVSYFSCPVIIPLRAEQEAIAEALSDADALIESLKQLIAKKRQIKQGTMQALLTGKQRLPGFEGKWHRKALSELFGFSGGYSASRDQLSAEGHCYLHYGDIHTSTKSFVDVTAERQELPRLDIPLNKVNANSLLKDGDVVFVDASEDDDGTSKHVVVINRDNLPFVSGLHTIVAKSKTDELDHVFRRYCFQTSDIKQQFRFFAVGTKVSGVSKSNIGKIELSLPPVVEQCAIATILTDMDTEIVNLETRLAKTRQLKQGMMQELLTGRVRLVGPSKMDVLRC